MDVRRIFSLGAAAAVLTVCGGAPTNPDQDAGDLVRAEVNFEASLSADIQLRVGETAGLDGGFFRVTFIRVAGDSRCPTDATCVWEGDAEARFMIDHERLGPVRTSLHTHPDFGHETTAGRYTVRLIDVLPHPTVAEGSSEDPVAVIRVTDSGD